MPYIKLSYLTEYKIPLPSLEEQMRIIEELDSYQNIIDGAKRIIDNWKPTLNVNKDWQNVLLSEVATTEYGTSKKSQTSGKAIVLRMGNLQKGEIVFSDLAYSSDQQDIDKFTLSKGDILFNRTNSIELVGKTSIFRGYESTVIFAGYLLVLE